MWKIYAEVLYGEYRQKAFNLAAKAVNINKFLIEQDIYFPQNVALDFTVTYHDPCHLARSQGVKDEPRELLAKINGVKYIELEDAGKCCGASGTFCFSNPEISKIISSKKAQNIVNTGSEIASTSCPSCKMGINQGLNAINARKMIYEPVELLAMLYLKEFDS
ncbi:MAG: heterodisulfide reductase-related iron-sulfur binding cluster [Bacillus subtilis]|nr:heterodisulfide reductase-related iron-sulfur binding cluster [Bacillus subtilis]